MKKVHKSVFFVVLALVFAFVFINFFGIYTTYGDVTTTIVRGYKDLGYDRDLEDMGYFAIKSENIDAADLNAARDIVENRISTLGYRQFNVLVDEQNGQLLVEVPFAEANAANLPSLAQAVASTGLFEIREGNETDDDGNPTGVSETVILNNDMVRSVRMSVQSNALYTYYGIEVFLTKEGKAALSEVSTKLLADDKGTISYWLDGEKIGIRNFTEPLELSSITITDTTNNSYSVSYERQVLMASGRLPAAFTAVESVVIPNANSDASQSALLWGLLAAIGVAIVLFIILFKLPGVCAGAMILLQSAMSLAIQTGMFTDQTNRMLNFNDLTAHVVLLLISMLVYAFICSKVSAGVNQKLSPAKAVLNATNGPQAKILFGFVGLFVLSLCAYLLTNPTLLYGSGVYAYLGDMNEMFRTAMLISALALLCQVFFRLMLKSISGGNWRSGSAFCSPLSKGKEKNVAAASKSVVIAVALVLVASVALGFILNGAPSSEKDGYSLYSVSYSTEDVDSAVLTPALLELDSSLDVSYGYATGGTAYSVTVMLPAGSETTNEQIKAVMDEAYPEAFKEIMSASVSGSYNMAAIRNLAAILLISIIAFGAVVSLLANRFRMGGVVAAVCTLIGTAVSCALLYVCGMPFGHTFMAIAVGAAVMSAGVSAMSVFSVNAAKTAQNTKTAAVNEAVSGSLGGCVAAIVIFLLMFAAFVVVSISMGIPPVANFAVGMLAVSVISAVYCYAASNAIATIKK